MKLRNTSRAMVAGMAIAAALTMTACSSDEPETPTGGTGGAATTTTTAATADPAIPPAPTAEELNAMLQTGLDPNIPATEKTDLIQGSEADPELINRVATVVQQNNASVRVLAVQDAGDGTALANAEITFNGQANPTAVQLVYDNGKWKLEKAFACNLVQLSQLQSAACP